MANSFSNNLKKYRNEKGLGINELGRKIGVSGAYISALETGKKVNPSLDVIDKISSALDIPSSFLTSSSYNESINNNQINEGYNKFEVSKQFFNLLGYKIDFKESNEVILIDDVEYSLDQFDSLLDMLKHSINDINKILNK